MFWYIQCLWHGAECVAPNRETNKEHHREFMEETSSDWGKVV